MTVVAEAVKVPYSQTLEAMRAAVAEKGEGYVYKRQVHPDSPDTGLTSCLNTTPDRTAPGCLAGEVFHRVGVPLEWLADMANINSGATAVVAKLRHEGKFDFDDASVKLLSEAQSYQDSGTPWGSALEKAIKYVETGVHEN